MRIVRFAITSCVVLLLAGSCNSNHPDKPQTAVVPDYEVVLDLFKQINAVPRPSTHEQKIRQWLQDFAATRNLECCENKGNIILRKPATKGMEKAPTVVLQAHMDMLCVAAEGYNINFLEAGIESEKVGGFIRSKDNKTSLGADNGIGMAVALAVLDSKEIVHGPLECLFTWDKERGMSGAAALEPGILQGRYMLCLDAKEEGCLVVGTTDSVAPWLQDPNDVLVVYAQRVYQTLQGQPMELLTVDEELEASLFSDTYPDLHIIGYGPTISDAHSVHECVEIATVATVWKYTVHLLFSISDIYL